MGRRLEGRAHATSQALQHTPHSPRWRRRIRSVKTATKRFWNAPFATVSHYPTRAGGAVVPGARNPLPGWAAGVTMDHKANRSHSDLFLVRVWRERLGEGRAEWRGKVRHALTGEVAYFRNWPELIGAIVKMLAGSEHDRL